MAKARRGSRARYNPVSRCKARLPLVRAALIRSPKSSDHALRARLHKRFARRRQVEIEKLPMPALEQHADEKLGRLLGVVDREYFAIA